MKITDEINNFLSFNKESLIDHVAEDLKLDIDYELSQIYDMVDEKFHGVSFEEIIDATVERIKVAIETFESDDK